MIPRPPVKDSRILQLGLSKSGCYLIECRSREMKIPRHSVRLPMRDRRPDTFAMGHLPDFLISKITLESDFADDVTKVEI